MAASITFVLCLLSFPPFFLSAPIQSQHHKLSVRLTGPSTISQKSNHAGRRTLLYLFCTSWSVSLCAEHVSVANYSFYNGDLLFATLEISEFFWTLQIYSWYENFFKYIFQKRSMHVNGFHSHVQTFCAFFFCFFKPKKCDAPVNCMAGLTVVQNN